MNNKNHNIDEEKLFDVRDFLYKFLHRKNLFIYFALPIFFGIIISQLTKPYNPIYRATFDIGVTEEKAVEGFFSTYRDYQTGTVTQRVISNLLSANLAEKVIDTLGLYYHVKNGNSHFKIETNVKDDFISPLGPFKIKINGNKFSLFSKSGEKIKEGELDGIIDLGVLEFKVIPLKEIPKGETYTVTFYPRNIMALGLRNSLAIKSLDINKIEKGFGSSGTSFTGEGASKKLVTSEERYYYPRGPGILRISVYWGDPGNALRIANALSELIISEDKREKSQRFIQSKAFIDSQLIFYQAKLNKLEDEIRDFKKRKKIVDLKASTQALIDQISQLESRKNQLQIEEKILKDLGEHLANQREGIDTTFNFAVTLVSDPVFQNFYSQLLRVEAELKGKLNEYSAGHPKVLGTKAKLDGLKEQMKEESTKRMLTIKTEIQSVESQIGTLQANLKNVPEDEIHLARFERDKRTAEKLYTFFAEKLEETRVQEVGVTSDLKVINPPLVPSNPVNSKGTFKSLVAALVISIMAGGFAVFIAEYLDNTVKDPDMVSKNIGLPIFASIPIIEDEKGKSKKENLINILGILSEKGKIKKEKSRRTLRILDEDISSVEFEAFRKLAINLEFADPEKKYQVIYVTSAGPEEGKTFIALNMGLALGVTNKKIVVIDTDFRKKRGRLTDILKPKMKEGLFDILKGEIELKNAIIPFKIPSTSAEIRLNQISQGNENLSRLPRGSETIPHGDAVVLLPVGKIPPNPLAFLDSEKMKNLITELKSKYDYVIIDGVPLLLFADATYLANFSDGVLLTARYGKTKFKELEYSRSMLVSSKSNIIGIVMNFVPKTLGSYYYHYYYHKYYPKYYKKE